MDPIKKIKDEKNIKEITNKEVMNLLSINKIPIKDEEYVKEHLVIKKKSKTDYYEIKVTDIDGSIHTFQIELKTYP
jgi:phage antirepressor YoqD-like protein